MYEASHEVILSLQAGRSEASFKFYNWVSGITDEGIYTISLLLMLPFLSRERFWYLFIAFHVAEFVKCILKLTYHEPRPTWIWTDILPVGCSASFGLPSGHSTESANFVLVLLLDQFRASKWSRLTYPDLNTKTISNAPLAFAAMLLLFFTYWPLVVYDRILLGKHTLNQVFLGSQIGFWCACFSHFCLRDSIFRHITTISNGKMRITSDEAYKYARTAALIIITLFTTAVAVSYLSALPATIKQTWMINLSNTCGTKFETDSDGNFVV